MKMFIRALGVVVVLFVAGASASADDGWTLLENARLDTSGYSDGDSFSIRADGKSYVFRLYFVDCPETDASLKERVQEQASAWRLRESDILKYGKKATQYAMRELGGEELTIYTRWSDARGGGRHKRYFAFIEVNGEFFSEMLVRDGWARSYGQIAPRPDGKSSSTVRSLYDRLSSQARANKKGVWGGKTQEEKSDPVSKALRDNTMTASHMIPVYSSRDPSRHVKFIRSGQTFGVLSDEGNGFVRVRFEAADDKKIYEALVKKSDIGI